MSEPIIEPYLDFLLVALTERPKVRAAMDELRVRPEHLCCTRSVLNAIDTLGEGGFGRVLFDFSRGVGEMYRLMAALAEERGDVERGISYRDASTEVPRRAMTFNAVSEYSRRQQNR